VETTRRASDESPAPSIRLQLWLARAGLASRRQAERIILEGRVTVDGIVVKELGSKASLDADVRVDGKKLALETRLVYYVLNKPAGYLSSMQDPEGRKLAIDLLKDLPERVYNVGRLDQWSSGLLIFTNDGELARALSHPSSGIEKEYEVESDLALSEELLSRFERGVTIDGIEYRAKRITQIGEKKARIVLIEGKNREIRRVFEYFGLRALALSRVRIGPLRIGGLAQGQYREMLPEEVAALRNCLHN
jgi:23S rRNA pseudouridine2605 synthase